MLYSHTIKLVRFYEGADGLKTGFTDNAGYCMAVTAKRDGMRLIAIVLGASSGKIRNQETSNLLDYGFNLYKVDVVKTKKDIITEIKINRGTKNIVTLSPVEDIVILKKKSELSKKYDLEINLNDINLPIKKGEILGKVLVKDGTNTIRKVDLMANDSINKLGYFKTIIETLKEMLVGNMI